MGRAALHLWWQRIQSPEGTVVWDSSCILHLFQKTPKGQLIQSRRRCLILAKAGLGLGIEPRPSARIADALPRFGFELGSPPPKPNPDYVLAS